MDRREAMAQSYLSELQPISAYITLRSVVLFSESEKFRTEPRPHGDGKTSPLSDFKT